MPELPEVETIVRGLRGLILDRRILSVELLRAHMLKNGAEAEKIYRRFFKNRTFTSIDRRGKYLIFTLDNGCKLIAHLGMTGKFVFSCHPHPLPKHLCSIYYLEDDFRLDHVDPRRFGRLALYQNDEPIPELEKLGPDPISPEFSGNSLEILLKSSRAIHTLLLDQNLVSGVGNIYASEALHRAGIHPELPAVKLNRKHLGWLANELRQVMTEAIEQGGTTVSDYRRVNDKPGSFLEFLRVYERKGQPCKTCGQSIEQVRLGGRSAYFCPKCQPQRIRSASI
jgi:formamidopyrimidine-DNA glycosylase